MMQSLLHSDFSTALAWTLLHSLWQVTFIVIILMLVLRLLRHRSAQLKYLISLSALGQALVLALVTFSIYYIKHESSSEVPVSPGQMIPLDIGIVGTANKIEWITELLRNYTPHIVAVWAIGSLLFLLKFIAGYTYVLHMANTAKEEVKSVVKKVDKLRKKFDISRKVSIKCSTAIRTPMVLGIIKPVILFPVGMVNQLTPQELEAVLSHELAHIRQHDFVINIIQSIIESIFYYHPGIWMISRIIHEEREACCDDLAVQATGHKISYAKTLIKLQELQQQQAIAPALGLTGKYKPFSNRIKRLLNLPLQLPRIRERVVSMMVLCLVMISVIGQGSSSNAIEIGDLDVYIIDDCPANESEIKYYLDTIPDRNSFHIKKRSLDKEVELHMEEGMVKSLKVDGEEFNHLDRNAIQNIIEELQPTKKENLITVFPDCGEGFGKVYYVDSNRQAINLDNYFALELIGQENHDLLQELESLKGNEFDTQYLDTIQKGIQLLDWTKIQQNPKIQIDSIFDLFPQQWSMSPVKETLLEY